MTPIRLALILIALAFPCAPAYADPSDVPQWYGTIRFTKTLARRTDDPPEFQGRPGKKFMDVKITWSGTMKFVPGNKAVVVASFTHHREVDRREDKTGPCYFKDGQFASHDYENLRSDIKVSVNREENNRLLFRVAPDGAYRVSVIVGGGKHVDKAQKGRIWRETYSECSPPAKVHDDPVESSAGMESLTLFHIQGKDKPGATTLKGSYSAPDDDEGKLSYSWDLTLAPPELVARAKATSSPMVRGDSITLDGKDSIGKIDKYEWQFMPDGDCQMTREGIALRLTGQTVTFKALCDFTAELTVSNSKTSDRASQPVIVEARKGDAWKTKFTTVVGPSLKDEPFTPLESLAGANRCALHLTKLKDNHWLHTTAVDAKPWTWRDSGGYVLAQIQDSGPFKGAWYVKSQSLTVDRQERVNNTIAPGGANWEFNLSKGNTKALADWAVQVKAHEAAHSALVQEKLDMLRPDRDPAVVIEKYVGVLGEEEAVTRVDMSVREVEGILQEASSEANVANRLRPDPRFKDPISVWLPGPDGYFKKAMGPLWQIGE